MIPNYDQEIEKRYHPENFEEERPEPKVRRMIKLMVEDGVCPPPGFLISLDEKEYIANNLK